MTHNRTCVTNNIFYNRRYICDETMKMATLKRSYYDNSIHNNNSRCEAIGAPVRLVRENVINTSNTFYAIELSQ